MVDFHSHFLPGIDDGSDSVETSLAMLRESRRQGIELMCATPHFYADEVDPVFFLERRNRAWDTLREEMEKTGESWPEVLLGAEVLYFPGISVAEEIRNLRLEGSPFLLVEPPMIPWSNAILDEIEQCGETLDCIPVVAHLDRYMRILNDYTLFDRMEDREILIQVNASFFLHRSTEEMANNMLLEDRIQFIGSDCHNMEERRPNIGDAAQIIRQNGLSNEFSAFNDRLNHVMNRALRRVGKKTLHVSEYLQED
jgi:protein-tyrosine phosphatase